MIVAQATGAPYNGANNASDFQPQTRNPQADSLPTQPQTGNLQNPAASEVLGKQNVRIIVPKSSANATTEPYSSTVKSDGMGDVFAIIALGVVILAITSFLFHRRKKISRSRAASTPKEEVIVPPPLKKPKSTKKKSKHKQKHKRK